ncbi:hypothetical protein NQZ68_005417 [Dissostichus eleginoides]|nr:hypothetical protein NQZ68_005417 [Dissostichus eleginoides]
MGNTPTAKKGNEMESERVLIACAGVQGLFPLKFPGCRVRAQSRCTSKADIWPVGGSRADRHSVNCNRK